MDVQVNLWGVLLAALASMVIGTLWYSPALLGKEWMSLVRMDEQKAMRGRNMSIAVAFIMSLLLAYVLAHVSFLSYRFFGGSFTKDALSTAFWLWLGIAFTRTVTHDAFEQRRRRLTAINVGNQLVTMLVMGLIIGWVGFS
jgi:hypothetical protein